MSPIVALLSTIRAQSRKRPRFLGSHFTGYSTNLLILVILVDGMEFSRQIVQLAAVLIVALSLFRLFCLWVFLPSCGL